MNAANNVIGFSRRLAPTRPIAITRPRAAAVDHHLAFADSMETAFLGLLAFGVLLAAAAFLHLGLPPGGGRDAGVLLLRAAAAIAATGTLAGIVKGLAHLALTSAVARKNPAA